MGGEIICLILISLVRIGVICVLAAIAPEWVVVLIYLHVGADVKMEYQKSHIGVRRTKTRGEYREIVHRAYLRICKMRELDDGSNPKYSKKLKYAEAKLDAILDGIDCSIEYDY